MRKMEAEERLLLQQQLQRRVVLLQACVRGYFIRKQFRSLKGEYESIVKEIEGNLDQLQWNGHFIPRPVFLPKSVQKPRRRKELSIPGAGSTKSHTQNKEETLCCELELHARHEGDSVMQLPSRPAADVLAKAESNDVRQDPENLVDRHSEDGCSLPGESEEGKDCSHVSSEWNSSILEAEAPRLSQELSFQRGEEMPQALPDLQHYRKHLAMELLWLQQAIASRKNYLILKQRMGNPE